MSAENGVRYVELGKFVAERRAKAGLKQSEFADLVGSSQQTISRWEAGTARPRQRDLGRVAAVLGVSVDDLHAAAGYRSKGEVVASFDKPFPLHALAPDSFERFCAELLTRRLGPTAVVNRAGKEGHAQNGIDISVATGNAVDVYQCKRVDRFGPARLNAAIAAAAGVQSRSKVLMLACVASPDTRTASVGTGWEIWDQDDISRMVRGLAKQDQLDLVDMFFRGQRFALLGVQEANAWQTPEQFFRPFLGEKVFGHDWALVGRDRERQELLTALNDQGKELVLLLGVGGAGKSRLLWESLKEFGSQQGAPSIRMLVPQVPVTPQSLEDLDGVNTLLVVDDAHDREDLALLLRHVAASGGMRRLLLSLRPYGLDSVRRQAASLSMTGGGVTEVRIGALDEDSAKELARQVLLRGGGRPDFASVIAKHTHESPLLTVLSAHVAARDGLHPEFIGNTDEFRHRVQLEFERVVTQDIVKGADSDRLTELLALISLVQPIAKDDESLHRLVEAVAQISVPQTARLLNLLVSAGVLFQRGRTYRLAPDLLTDSIIERACFSPAGASLGYAEKVFDAAPPSYLKNLMLNLGRLDWRKNGGDTSSSNLLSGIWAKLKWHSIYNNPHVDAALAVAFFQPRQAIQFARDLIRQGHGADRHVAEMLKYAAYNEPFAKKAMLMLWALGRDDERAQGQHPSHPIRILKSLATPEPNKPVGYVKLVVDTFLQLLRRENELQFKWTPFDVLDGALALQTRTHTTRRSEVVISQFHVDLGVMREVRCAVRDAAIQSLASPIPHIAFRAAIALSTCVQGPIGSGFYSDDAADEHRAFVLQTIAAVKELVESTWLPPVVLVRIVQSLANRARRSELQPIKDRVQAIYAQLERDLRTRVIRAMMDAWGTNIRDPDGPIADNVIEDSERWLRGLVEDVLQEHPEPHELADFLAGCVEEVRRARTDDSSHRFLRLLVDRSIPLAKVVLSIHHCGDSHILREQAGPALATLLRDEQAGDGLIEELLASPTTENLVLLAEGLTLAGEKERVRPAARQAIGLIVESKEPSVLWRASHLMIQVAREEPAYALEQICKVDLLAAGAATHDLFMVFGSSGLIPASCVTEQVIGKLLGNLEEVPDLSDYWILDFLKVAAKRDVAALLTFVKRRLLNAVADRDWNFEALPAAARLDDTLGLLDSDVVISGLVDLLDWALEHVEKPGFKDRFGTAVAAMCGPFNADVLEALLGWLHFGTDAHVQVVAAVVAEGPRSMLLQHSSDVVRMLDEAEPISEEAVEELRSAFWRASYSGVRMSTPGQPTTEDLEMVRVADEVLGRLMPFDPAYDLYELLKRDAERNVELAGREREAMELDDA